MVALGKAIARASSGLRRPDRYELRMDFENGLYSVAHADKDSLDLDFLSGKFLAEQDANAGAKALTDLVTWTRPEPAWKRNASGNLVQDGVDVPREGHHPAPRIVGTTLSEDFSSFADLAALLADPRYSNPLGTVTFDAAADEVTAEFAGSNGRFQYNFTGLLEVGKVYRLGMLCTATSGSCNFSASHSGGTYKTTNFSVGWVFSDPFRAVAADVFGIVNQFSAGATTVSRILIQELSHRDGEDAGLLIEPEQENLVPDRNPLNWGSGNAGDGGAVQGIDGIAGSARLIEDNSGTVIGSRFFDVTIPEDTNINLGVFTIRKESAPTHFPGIGYEYYAGTSIRAQYTLDTRTGELSQRSASNVVPADILLVEDWGDYWRVLIGLANNGAGSNVARFTLFPAVNTDAGGNWIASATGATAVDQCEFILNARFSAAPIFTAGAPVTRGADLPDVSSWASSLWTPRVGDAGFSLAVQWTSAPYPGGVINPMLFEARDSALANRIRVNAARAGSDNVPQVNLQSGGASVSAATFFGNDGLDGERHGIALRWGGGTSAISLDGSGPTLDSDAPSPQEAFSEFFLGTAFHGVIHSLKMTPAQWDDATVQAEATP